jgi:NADH:ubiquinone oxidoreductase subunit 2 (subunit N)
MKEGVLLYITQGKPCDEQQLARFVVQNGLSGMPLSVAGRSEDTQSFYDAYKVDYFSQFFKIIMSLGLVAVVILTSGLKGITNRVKAEYYLFMTLSTLGLVFLVSANELITLFVALAITVGMLRSFFRIAVIKTDCSRFSPIPTMTVSISSIPIDFIDSASVICMQTACVTLS